MNDPNDPHADPRVDALLSGMAPGDPFAEEVERLLADGGPVPVHDRDVDDVVNSLQARFSARSDRRTPRRWVGVPLLAAAAVLAAVSGLSWVAGQRSVTLQAVVAVAPIAADAAFGETRVDLRSGSIAEVQGDTVVLVEGIVSIARTDPRQTGAHRVRVSGMDLTIEPVGTVYYVGTRDDLAAVWVVEGRVRLMHQTQGHLGEVAAGSWALISGSGPGLELHRVPDGPFDPELIGLDLQAAELLADMRWMALPEGAKAAILTAGDAP